MSDIIPNVVVSMPSQLFTMPRKFGAVFGGRIYIGKIDTDPTIPSNQIQVYLENEDGSLVPMAQPILINAGGYPVYNGNIAKFVTVQGHSMAVYDALNVQQFYFPNILKYDPDQLRQELNTSTGSGLVGFDENIQYQAGTVGDELNKLIYKNSLRVESVADLSAIKKANVGYFAETLSYYYGENKGGSIYIAITKNSSIENYGEYIEGNGVTWKNVSREFYASMFGIKDSVTSVEDRISEAVIASTKRKLIFDVSDVINVDKITAYVPDGVLINIDWRDAKFKTKQTSGNTSCLIIGTDDPQTKTEIVFSGLLTIDGISMPDQWYAPDPTNVSVLYALDIKADKFTSTNKIVINNCWGMAARIRYVSYMNIEYLSGVNVGGRSGATDQYESFGDAVYIGNFKHNAQLTIGTLDVVGKINGVANISRCGITLEDLSDSLLRPSCTLQLSNVRLVNFMRTLHAEGVGVARCSFCNLTSINSCVMIYGYSNTLLSATIDNVYFEQNSELTFSGSGGVGVSSTVNINGGSIIKKNIGEQIGLRLFLRGVDYVADYQSVIIGLSTNGQFSMFGGSLTLGGGAITLLAYGTNVKIVCSHILSSTVTTILPGGVFYQAGNNLDNVVIQ
ncbi:phage head-binding domain-containing protein [Yersinia pseudotuberculosis]|uniref:phage head-binding domain-containing protein n=1 Tax=Yersinia pseudotuberculosis TaxID=633 RepID=UPI002B3197A5|nr:hypothetical protein YPSE1_28230 [Yersinia pseudotuberculosis]